MKKLAAAFVCSAVIALGMIGVSRGQLPGFSISVQSGAGTPIVGGINGNCLYDNNHKAAEQACGSGTGNALFGTTTGNTANDIVSMSNTTVGVQDSGILSSNVDLLNGAQTITGQKTYNANIVLGTGVLQSPADGIQVQGSSTGVSQFQSALTGSSNSTVIFPADATATLVDTTGTQTLTNKTLTAPALTNPTIGAGSAVTSSGPGGALTATAYAAAGQVPGTATNDGGSAGNVGEYVVSGANSFNNTNFGATTVTISIASPAVISWTGNPYFLSTATGNGCASIVVFSTSGALPTGLTAGTNYYVTCDASFTANAFHVSTSIANAVAGTAINTSGTQSGTQQANNVYALTTNTPIDFGGMQLSAGDWDVTGVVVFIAAATTSITLSEGGITSATILGGTQYAFIEQRQAAEVPGGGYQLVMSTERVSLSAPATLFCSVDTLFTVSTMKVSGECRARRVR